MSMYVPITSNYNININSTSIINQSGSGQNILKSTLITDLSVNGILTLPNQSISDSALSANVPLKNSYNIFSNTNLFSGLVNFQNGGTYISQIFANGNLFSFTNSNLGGTIEFFCNTLTIADLVSPLRLSYTGLITDNITMNANQTLTMSSGSGVINQQGGSGTNTLKSSTFSGNTTIQSGSSLILNNSLNTISTRIFQNGATLTFTNLSTPSQYLFNAYDGFGTLYPYTFGSTFSCGADITLNNYDLILSGVAKIDQSMSSGVNTMGAITMNAGTNITQSTSGIISQSGTGTNTMKAITMVAGTNITQTTTSIIDQSSSTGGINLLKAITMNANANFLQSGSGILSQAGTGTNTMKAISMISNADITFQGTGKIDQSASSGTNILKNTTFSSGSVINQYNSTGAVYTSLSQTDTTTYLIENQYNTSTITLRNKNAVGTSINHSFAYNRVSLGSLLQMGANLDIVLQGTGIIDQTIGTGTNILNTIKFNNSTTNKQITLYENSPTDIASNYTISVEGSRIRYNVNSGATHLFSTGTGVSTYSTHASINSTGLTMAGNRNIIISGSGILSQSGAGVNLMKNITMNADNNLLQSGIGVIQQSGTGTNALKGSTFSANNTHYNGSAIIQYDSTNVFYTQLNQSGVDYYITNGGGSIFLNANEVNLTNSYATLKGGTSVSGYSTHFPFTDGINYITGQTIMRGGSVEITDGPLVLPNGTPINLFDAEPTPNQCTIVCSVGDLAFDNYTDPLITSGGGNIKFSTYNLTTPIPRFHTRLNINYDGIQVKKGHLKIYNDAETQNTESSQVGLDYFIKNSASGGTIQLKVNNTGGIAILQNNLVIETISDFKGTSTYQSGSKVCLFESTNTDQTRIENLSTGFAITTEKQNGVINFNCYDGGFISQNVLSLTDSTIQSKKNITLPTTQTTQTSGQLGYIHQGTILNIASPVNNTTGTIYYLASMTLPVGVWNVFAQSCYTFSTGGTIANDSTSISTNQSSYSIENIINFTNVIATTGINIYRRLNGIITSTGSTTLYLTFGLTGFSGGAVPQHSNSTQTYTRFYAVRIA